MYKGIEIDSTFKKYSCPVDWWEFVPTADIYSVEHDSSWTGAQIHRSLLDSFVLISHKRIYRSNPYNSGPEAIETYAITNKVVEQYNIVRAEEPGVGKINGHDIALYYPSILDVIYKGIVVIPPHVIPAPQCINPPQPIISNKDEIPQFQYYIERMRRR
ncbi:MAG: hypothetical protein P4L41_08670 [Flavipsychrobacter sp.]|nr:hypothetical protein [Flavipsychrobacter sp.]